jgi:hypothetical protein
VLPERTERPGREVPPLRRAGAAPDVPSSGTSPGLKPPAVEGQLDVIEPLIAECWRTRPNENGRRIHPITSGGPGRRIEPISRWLEPRAHLLTNKARFDRLLRLMQLQLDGLANETADACAIRDWLTSR